MLKPAPGYVLAEPIQDDTEVGGIALPENVKDKPAKARVTAVGEDTEKIELSNYKVGQTIVHKRWTPTTIKENGKEIIFVSGEDILGYDN